MHTLHRAYAVYQKNKAVLLLLSSLLALHLILLVWIFTKECTVLTLDSFCIISWLGTRDSFCVQCTSCLRLAAADSSVPVRRLYRHRWKIAQTSLRDICSHDSGILFVAPAIIFDTVVGSLLTFGLYRRSRKDGAQTPLTRLVIEDGLLYFAVMFASNVAWILVHVLERDNLVGHSMFWVAVRRLISRGCSIVYRYPGLYTIRNVSCRYVFWCLCALTTGELIR